MVILNREIKILEVLGKDLLITGPFSSSVSTRACLGNEVDPAIAKDFKPVLVLQITERIDWVSRWVVIEIVEVIDVPGISGGTIALLIQIDDYTTSSGCRSSSVGLGGHTNDALNIEIRDEDFAANTLLRAITLPDHEQVGCALGGRVVTGGEGYSLPVESDGVVFVEVISELFLNAELSSEGCGSSSPSWCPVSVIETSASDIAAIAVVEEYSTTRSRTHSFSPITTRLYASFS